MKRSTPEDGAWSGEVIGNSILVSLNQVSKSYSTGEVTTEVLKDVNLAISRDQFVVGLGVSGCGKTTLLNLIGALDTPTAGGVVVDGQIISSMGDRARTEFRCRRVGFIFQFYNLLSTLTAIENVEAGLEILPLSRAEIRARADHYLKAVSLDGKADKFPAQLSGGEQQRVAIARALAKEPVLVLADEPTGNLDEETGLSVMRLMSDLHRNNHGSFVVATHNPRMAALADRVVHIEHGRIVEVPQPAEVIG